jgi:hypothetical protein
MATPDCMSTSSLVRGVLAPGAREPQEAPSTWVVPLFTVLPGLQDREGGHKLEGILVVSHMLPYHYTCRAWRRALTRL